MIKKTVDKNHYKRYSFKNELNTGFIVLEKYGDIWNLELMSMQPTGRGWGSKFLLEVLKRENLLAEEMTVCPISEESRRFFRRHGFNT